MSKRRGFTLIELLVVISIIAVLLSILMPALQKAKKQARKVVCSAQLRGMAQGVIAYSTANDGRLPIYTQSDKPTDASLLHDNQVNLWGKEDSIAHSGPPRKLTPYLGRKIGRCPSDKGFQPGSSLDGTFYTSGNFYEVYGSSYIYNTAALDFANGSSVTPLGESWGVDGIVDVLYSRRMENIRQSTKLVMGADRTLFYAYYTTYGFYDWFTYMKMHDLRSQLCNMVFMDSHVKGYILHEPPEHFRNGDYQLLR